MGGDKRLQQLGQDVGADRRRRRDHQVPGRSGHDLLQRVATFCESSQRPFGVRHPRLAGIRQPHAVRCAQEEGSAQFAFEAVEAGGQRRLGDEKRFRRPADAAAARHLQESFHLDELKGVDLAVTWFVYGHGRGHKFYLWRRRSETPDQIASAHTGPIVMMNGRMVSLAECESRSKAMKTRTVPYASTARAIPTIPNVFTFISTEW